MHHRLCLCVLACLLASLPATFADPAQSDEHLVDMAQRLFASDPQAGTETFRKFFENAEAGTKTDLDDMDQGKKKDDPGSSEVWNINRNIPVAWIRWLCTDRQASKKVRTQLEIDYARIAGKLDLTGADVPFSLLCYKCAFTGPIVLDKANIRGLTLLKTCLNGIVATTLSVKQNFWFSECVASRTVWLRGVAIDGMMLCDLTQFHRDPWDGETNDLPHGLHLESARIKGDLSLKNIYSLGVVVLAGAEIGGSVDFQGARVDGKSHEPNHPNADQAIYAPGMKVGGDLLLGNKFEAAGPVVIPGTVIGGNLDCRDGKFSGGEASCLYGANVKLGGDVRLSGQFVAQGEVDLRGATMGGDLECDGRFTTSAGGAALSVISAKIGGGALLNVKAVGPLDFSDASIARRFSLESPPGPNAPLILRDAKAGALTQACLPTPGLLDLDGFVFAGFDNLPPLAVQKDWLLRQKQPASSQPYEQVATVLRAMGLDDQAREILVLKNEERGKKAQGWAELLWYRLVGPFIRYGYYPWSAFYLSLVLIGLGTVLFGLGKRLDLITPTREDAYADRDIALGKLTEFYPTFNAFIFSLETFVPFLHLNVSDHWAPNPNRGNKFLRDGRALRVYLWLHIIIGFVLTTLWIGGLTGLIKT